MSYADIMTYVNEFARERPTSPTHRFTIHNELVYNDSRESVTIWWQYGGGHESETLDPEVQHLDPGEKWERRWQSPARSSHQLCCRYRPKDVTYSACTDAKAPSPNDGSISYQVSDIIKEAKPQPQRNIGDYKFETLNLDLTKGLLGSSLAEVNYSFRAECIVLGLLTLASFFVFLLNHQSDWSCRKSPQSWNEALVHS